MLNGQVYKQWDIVFIEPPKVDEVSPYWICQIYEMWEISTFNVSLLTNKLDEHRYISGRWFLRHSDVFGRKTLCSDPQKIYLSDSFSPENSVENIVGHCRVLFLPQDSTFDIIRDKLPQTTFYCTQIYNSQRKELRRVEKFRIESTIKFLQENAVILTPPKV